MTSQEILRRKVYRRLREIQETIQEEAPPKEGEPQERFMTVITGKGTPKEVRELTDTKLYWADTLNRWVTIPED